MYWELNVGAPLIGTETLPKMLKVQAIKMNSEITIKSHDKKMLMTERANSCNRRVIDGYEVVQNLL